jgi:hypothetical protein
MQKTVRETLMAAAAGLPNVHLFDPTPYFLDGNGRVTPMLPDGTLLFSDDHHLSVSGSLSLSEAFRRFLEREGLSPSTAPSPAIPRPAPASP